LATDAGLAKMAGLGLKTGIETISAADRAVEIANAMGRTGTGGWVTIGVTETAEGVRIISSSENALRPAARAMLGEGEIAVTGALTGAGHAEVTGVNAALILGYTPSGVAASIGLCPTCAKFLNRMGVAPLSLLRLQ
jgi:hypothetical protein